MPDPTFVVLTCRNVRRHVGFQPVDETVYEWDGESFPAVEEATYHAHRISEPAGPSRLSKDYVIAAVSGGRIICFAHEDPLATRERFDEIARQSGIGTDVPQEGAAEAGPA